MALIEAFGKIALELCTKQGITFTAKTNGETVAVKCTFSESLTKYILFEDHRKPSTHSNKPHICSHWHESLGQPIAFTLGKEITDEVLLHKIYSLTAVMCISKTEVYRKLKEELFANHSLEISEKEI